MNTIKSIKSGLAFIIAFTLLNCSASGESKELEFHGFISQGYLQSTKYNFQSHDSVDGSFHFNEVGINLSTDLTDNLRAGMQLLSRDYGVIGNNVLYVDWAYADYLIHDALSLRIGRMKTPRGLYNETRDIDLVRTSILLPQSLYSETLRDAFSSIDGIEVYGMLPLASMGDLLYKVQAGKTRFKEENSGAEFAYANGGLSVDEIEVDPGAIFSLEWLTPLDGLRLGTTLRYLGLNVIDEIPSVGNIEIDTTDMETYTLSAEYLCGDWIFNAEYQHLQADSKATAVLSPIPPFFPGGTSIDKSKIENQGWYVGSSYRVNDLLQLGTYYSFLNEVDKGDKVHDLALSTRFDLTPQWTLKFEGHWLNGGSSYYVNSSMEPDAKSIDSDDWMLFLMKTTISF